MDLAQGVMFPYRVTAMVAVSVVDLLILQTSLPTFDMWLLFQIHILSSPVARFCDNSKDSTAVVDIEISILRIRIHQAGDLIWQMC